MRYASVVCVSKHVMFTVCVVPITTTCHACIFTPCMCFMCVFAAYTANSRAENLVIYFNEMDIKYVSCLLSFLSVFRCWRGPG